MIESERERFLQRLAVFSDLEASELHALAEVTQIVQFPASALIFREGEAGDCAYVVVRGSVQVFATDRNGDEVVLAQLKDLDHVGEQSLLPGHSGRRNASVRACEDTTLLRIPKAEFQKILTSPAASPRNTLCGHAIAIACGYAALWVTGLQHAGPAMVAEFGWARILAAALSLATTGALMIRLNIPHPPAAATTLIVSLGLVSRPTYLVILEAGVALLVVQAIIINRVTGVRYPLWASVPTPKIGALASRGALQRFTRLL